MFYRRMLRETFRKDATDSKEKNYWIKSLVKPNEKEKDADEDISRQMSVENIFFMSSQVEVYRELFK